MADDLRQRLKNVHAYAVTPFARDDLLQLDLTGLTRNMEFLIRGGVKVINVCGGTGEINALTALELETVAARALDVADDDTLVTPTIPGNTGLAIELAARYRERGAKVALAMPPLMRDQVPDDLDGVYAHYALLAARAPGLLLLPYNTQGWPAEFFERLAGVEQIVGVKDPCVYPHKLFRAILRLGDRFVWIGNKRHDPGVLHFRYQAGIDGFTAGIINFLPGPELNLHQAALQADWEQMVELQGRLAPLEQLRNQYGDGLLKAGLDIVGLAGGRVRPPRVDVNAEGCDRLRDHLKKEWGLP
ncbi:MAG: dihydrodipicolinate synthase family protein [Candidatus Latescibacterota bacterium]|nr:dihydrodipicolinate synthase family protein [Candidatus Latescibacterota bacterium]